MNCELASKRMHEYFDGDLARDQAVALKAHLLACPACRRTFDAYERTEAYAHAVMVAEPAKSAAAGGYDADALTARIMAGLPGQAKRQTWTRWFRNHPAVTAAAVFAVVMLSSFLTVWEQDEELIVRGADLTEVVIDGDTVIVPEGARVNGDLTVENGKTVVSGEIAGNLTVIDGSVNMASTAKILGNSREINQALDWIWYKVTSTVGELAS